MGWIHGPEPRVFAQGAAMSGPLCRRAMPGETSTSDVLRAAKQAFMALRYRCLGGIEQPGSGFRFPVAFGETGCNMVCESGGMPLHLSPCSSGQRYLSCSVSARTGPSSGKPGLPSQAVPLADRGSGPGIFTPEHFFRGCVLLGGILISLCFSVHRQSCADGMQAACLSAK